MKYVVYVTMYTGDKLPKWYIGSSSKTRIVGGYNGSITSKKYKEIYKKEQLINKHLFKTRIVSHHLSRDEALCEEHRLQKMHNVVLNEKYINRAYATVNGFFGNDVSGKNNPMYGKKMSDESKEKLKYERTTETRKKLSEAAKGRTSPMKGKRHTQEAIEKMKESTNNSDYVGEKNPFFGKTHSQDSIDIIKKANIGRKDSAETRDKKSKSRMGELNPMFGVKRERIICEHCAKDTDTANYKRWHGENCKQLLTIGSFDDGTDFEETPTGPTTYEWNGYMVTEEGGF